MTKKTILINGRFMTRLPSGVDRFASELVKQVDDMLGSSHPLVAPFDFELLIPRGGALRWRPSHIALREIGPFTGTLWEQLTLPFGSRGNFLVNFCNTGPVIKRRQMVAIHDATCARQKDSFSLRFRTWYKILMPHLGKVADSILTVSEFSASEICDLYGVPRRKISVIHNGVGHMLSVRPDYSIIERLSLSSRPFVLAVATNAPHKNLRVLSELSKRPNFEDVPIVVAGGAGNGVFASAEQIQGDRVVYTGYVSDEELLALYQSASCFVFPSLYEGFGIPPVEAMAAGCPVVSSNASAMPEVLGAAALYFSPLDVQSLERAVLLVITKSDVRSGLISAGRIQASHYCWSASAQQFLKSLAVVGQ